MILRHSQARSRKAWRADDRQRPLLATGKHQAGRLVPLLAAYDVRRLVSSSSTRCVQTLEPYAAAIGRKLRTDDLLSEEDASREDGPAGWSPAGGELDDRPASAGGLVVCTHRPVLPWVFDAARARGPRARRPARWWCCTCARAGSASPSGTVASRGTDRASGGRATFS